MTKFKAGDHVRMFYHGHYHYGEVTLISEYRSNEEGKNKVIFGGDSELNYDYYIDDDLELVTADDVKDKDD